MEGRVATLYRYAKSSNDNGNSRNTEMGVRGLFESSMLFNPSEGTPAQVMANHQVEPDVEIQQHSTKPTPCGLRVRLAIRAAQKCKVIAVVHMQIHLVVMIIIDTTLHPGTP